MSFSSISPRRFWMANGLVVCLFAIVIYQLFQLSIVRRPALLEMADRQHFLRIEIPPLRGEILDRNGKELATNLKVPSIYAVPRMIAKEDKAEMAEKLAKILSLDRKFVLERISRDKAFVWLKRRTHYDEAEKIRALHSPALGVVKEFRRFYPQGDLLSHVLGFTNIDTHGIEGVELFMNKELQGRPGKRFTKRDALGREIRAYEMQQTPSMDGSRIVLTIDQYLQYLTERALDKAFVQWKAKGATAVVMEAKTGRILALATRPSFDPNHAGNSISDMRRNRTITDMYEPGSVFKIVAASAVLNEGKATPETSFFCENGAWRYGSKVLHDVHAYGKLSFSEVIIKSSNIGTVKAAALLKPEVLQSYIEAFGFGKRTGIDLPGEAPGYTRPPAQWSKTSPYNIPMGQEIMVTALQMVAAMDVIANGGNLMQPYIIERIEDQQGVILKEKKPVVRRRVIREDVAENMRRILTRVVEEGTGKSAMIKGISVGGKTGTAQKVLPNGRGYSHSNFMASFVGFAPSDEPEYVMGVVLDDPKPLYYGGTVSAPVFKEVMEVALLSKGYVPRNAETAALTATPGQNLPETRPKLVPGEGLAAKI